MNKKLTIFCLISISMHIFALSGQARKSYEVPDDMKHLLDSHHEELEKTFRNKYSENERVQSFPWLPGYVVKQMEPEERIAGGEKIKKIIARNPKTMNLITVPVQYRYIDEKSVHHNKYTIAEKEAGTVPHPEGSSSRYTLPILTYREQIVSWLGLSKKPVQLNLEQTKQLCNFIIASGWNGTFRDNYAIRSDGRISIIDTEDRNFSPRGDHRIARAIKGLDRLLAPAQQQYFSDDSKKYIREKFDEEKETAKQRGIELEQFGVHLRN